MTGTPARKPPYLLIAVVVVVVAGLGGWLLFGRGSGAAAAQKSVSGPYTVEFSTDGPKIGGNTFTVQVSGAAPAGVTVEPVMPQMGHALAPLTATAAGAGTYRVGDVALPMAGQWEVTVSLRGPAGPARLVFPLLVKG